MALIDVLLKNSFTEKEAKIYLALLELMEALPSQLARKTGIKRPTVYVTLQSLTERGLVSHVKKRNITYFQALDPHAFVEDQYHKYKSLEKSLPDLVNLHQRFGTVPQMTIYEGREGIINIMEDTLRTSTELLCWADTTLATQTLLKDYYPTYIATKVRRKVWLRGIFSYDQRALKFKKDGQKELREVYVIPKEKFPFKNEINIYDNKIAIVAHQDQIGVIIENKSIADTQRSIFNFGFEYAKILEQQILTAEDRKFLAN